MPCSALSSALARAFAGLTLAALPFLAFGAVVALFVGKPLLDAYFSTF